MRQVYRIDGDGFYIEPVLVHPEKVPVEVQVPNPHYVTPTPEEPETPIDPIEDPEEPPVDPPTEELPTEGEVIPHE